MASVILWKQKGENVLWAYFTKAVSQIISPAVKQTANLILKLPDVYFNFLIKILLASFSEMKIVIMTFLFNSWKNPHSPSILLSIMDH